MEKEHSGRRDSKCKGPEVTMCGAAPGIAVGAADAERSRGGSSVMRSHGEARVKADGVLGPWKGLQLPV